MENRYINRQLYFNEQSFTTEKFVIPYIHTHYNRNISTNTRILEIGCGEGGNIKPFLDRDCFVVGVDINKGQIENAHKFLSLHPNYNKLKLFDEDIYLLNKDQLGGEFDIIYMRDVIEHIPDQQKFMQHLKQFLKPDGIIYFGFPPWYMPFGGHQQACGHKIISKLPYIHILPTFLYRLILKILGLSEGGIAGLLEIKETGISIERFKKIVHDANYQVVDETMYLINPNYEVKFNLKTREQNKFLAKIPFFRNFYTTCCYYVIKMKV